MYGGEVIGDYELIDGSIVRLFYDRKWLLRAKRRLKRKSKSSFRK